MSEKKTSGFAVYLRRRRAKNGLTTMEVFKCDRDALQIAAIRRGCAPKAIIHDHIHLLVGEDAK